MRISAVIPILDMAAQLPACLGALRALGVAEVIVVDGGSTDGSVTVAAGLGATVLGVPASRGGQMQAGAVVAGGDWLLFVHADTVLTADLSTAEAGKAGYFRLRLSSERPAARWLERWSAWRSRWLGLPYGDQGLLIHRNLLAAVGGVPDLPLMEDVALGRRLGRRRLVLLAGTAESPAARYERDGFFSRACRNGCCLGLYFAGVPPRVIKRIYG